tara:strand:- start:276 stop:947 length:672 start_codon:yes stop_codon:yes gene_type:complete
MKNNKISILFLGKKGDECCNEALTFIKDSFSVVTYYLGKRDDSLPEDIARWNGDYIISYLSPWIIPKTVLKKCSISAINFHPATPNYPGIGCTNFALYEEAEEYGVTCHYMKAKVDTGKIIAVKRFPITKDDDVKSLTKRAYKLQLILFYEILDKIINDRPIPISTEKWTRKAFTRAELDALSIVDPSMNKKEVEKRIRATSYKNFQPVIKIYNYIFELKNKK